MSREDTNVLHVDPEILNELEQLAPGVRGYTVDQQGELYVPLIIADYPGEGDVGRYLDTLPRDRTVKVPNVLSGKLAGMLSRRGFSETYEWAAEHNQWVHVWIRRATP